MFARCLTAVLLATTAGAFAATTAWADGKVKMKDDPYKSADTIEVLYDGDKVKVLGCFENDYGQDWCKIKYEGDKGYVRLSDLSFKKYSKPDIEVEFCVGDPNFQFCVDAD